MATPTKKPVALKDKPLKELEEMLAKDKKLKSDHLAHARRLGQEIEKLEILIENKQLKAQQKK